MSVIFVVEFESASLVKEVRSRLLAYANRLPFKGKHDDDDDYHADIDLMKPIEKDDPDPTFTTVLVSPHVDKGPYLFFTDTQKQIQMILFVVKDRLVFKIDHFCGKVEKSPNDAFLNAIGMSLEYMGGDAFRFDFLDGVVIKDNKGCLSYCVLSAVDGWLNPMSMTEKMVMEDARESLVRIREKLRRNHLRQGAAQSETSRKFCASMFTLVEKRVFIEAALQSGIKDVLYGKH